MQEDKRYEILRYLPTYGPMYVSVTYTGEPYYSEGFAVRLFKNDGTGWVANFESGWGSLATVLEFYDNNNLLVIAYGMCYVMNPNDTKPIDTFGGGYDGMLQSVDGRYIFHSDHDIRIIKKDGSFDTVDVGYYGVKDVKVENEIIKGVTYDFYYKPVPFEYNLITKELTIIGGIWDYIGDDTQEEVNFRKPWWKFW